MSVLAQHLKISRFKKYHNFKKKERIFLKKINKLEAFLFSKMVTHIFPVQIQRYQLVLRLQAIGSWPLFLQTITWKRKLTKKKKKKHSKPKIWFAPWENIAFSGVSPIKGKKKNPKEKHPAKAFCKKCYEKSKPWELCLITAMMGFLAVCTEQLKTNRHVTEAALVKMVCCSPIACQETYSPKQKILD